MALLGSRNGVIEISPNPKDIKLHPNMKTMDFILMLREFSKTIKNNLPVPMLLVFELHGVNYLGNYLSCNALGFVPRIITRAGLS